MLLVPVSFYHFTNLECPSNCHNCFYPPQSNSAVCAVCEFGFQLKNGLCLPASCSNGSFFDPLSAACVECPLPCSSCSSPLQCSSCASSQFVLSNGTCQDQCLVSNLMNPNSSWTYYNQTFQNCTSCSV